MSLRSDFDKTMDFPGFFKLIIKINYPHLAGGPKGYPSLLQELPSSSLILTQSQTLATPL